MLCVSQASTAIMDEASSSSSSASLALPSSSSSILRLGGGGGGGRAIDRHNPIIFDGRRSVAAPCSSSLPPINPKPYHQLQKAKKSKEQKRKTSKTSSSSSKKSADHPPPPPPPPPPLPVAVSSRYLLGDAAFLDGLSDSVVAAPTKHSSSVSSSSSSSSVVVLRVSLHCKGCEGKVRKHLSRMEGVTSFNIDFAAKKVTVVGDVTPVSVLASISKVKNAQLLTSGVSSSLSAPAPAPAPAPDTTKKKQ